MYLVNEAEELPVESPAELPVEAPAEPEVVEPVPTEPPASDPVPEPSTEPVATQPTHEVFMDLVQKRWERLSLVDLEAIRQNPECLVAMVQNRYAIRIEDAKSQVEVFLK